MAMRSARSLVYWKGLVWLQIPNHLPLVKKISGSVVNTIMFNMDMPDSIRQAISDDRGART
jgi:hypothetical protein